MNDRESQYWHMDKRISYAHIVSTILLLIAVVASAATFTSRVAVLESETSHNADAIRDAAKLNAQAIRDVRTDQSNQYAELVRRLERLDNKWSAQNPNQ